ncbi:hypothetical protein HWV62_24442 [Athelia sp. TMB]|nr:hypothetical protein HWV62_24442 [Athelia sp. TMB]
MRLPELAGNSTKRTPCTNRPLQCALCVYDSRGKHYPAVWSYNIEAHFAGQHQSYTLQARRLPDKFRKSLEISHLEQRELRIPDSLLPTFVAPLEEATSEVPMLMQPQIDAAPGESGVDKRKRAQSRPTRSTKGRI